jgi:hypothetical protein
MDSRQFDRSKQIMPRVVVIALALPRSTSLLPWAIAQKAGIETLSTHSEGEEERLKCNPFSQRLNRPILTNSLCNRLFVSSFLYACALSASRFACWSFINDLADCSLVLAAFISKFAGLYNNLRRSFYCLSLKILRMKLKQ